MSDRSAANPHRFYGTVAGTLGAFAIGLGIAELAGLAPYSLAGLAIGVGILVFGLVAWASRHATPERFHLGGQGLTPVYLGLGGGADWLGTVFLIGVPAMVYTQGAIGLAVVLGGGAGYLLAGTLFAAGLARSGRLTVPDFLAHRYESAAVRWVSAVTLVGVGVGLALAQVAAIAGLGVGLFGLDARLVYGVMLVAVLACLLPGGATSNLRAQIVQAMVALMGFILPLLILSARFTGVPLPQVMYGPVIQRIEAMEATMAVPSRLVALPDAWTFAGLAACLAFGVAMLPQHLSRYLAAPDARAARRVTGWSLLFVAVALATGPAYAVFVRSEVLANIIGQPISALPNWVAAWSGAGPTAVGTCDATEIDPRFPLCAGSAGDGNGLIDAAEFRLRPEAIVLIAPSIADLPLVVTALAAAGFAAASLAAIGSALSAAASAVAVDLAARPRSIATLRLASTALAGIAFGLAAALEIDGLRLALSALALGACALFPALAFGIWSRRSGGTAALAGMAAGILICLSVLVAGALAPRGGLSLAYIAASMLALPMGLLIHWVAGRIGAPAGPAAQLFLDRIRLPRRR